MSELHSLFFRLSPSTCTWYVQYLYLYLLQVELQAGSKRELECKLSRRTKYSYSTRRVLGLHSCERLTFLIVLKVFETQKYSHSNQKDEAGESEN